MSEDGRHLLLVANETVAATTLLDAMRRRGDNVHVTVLCPVNQPRRGYVVYADTRRASAGRRLDRALEQLRAAGIPAHGLVVEGDPVDAVRDALAQLEPPIDEILVSTHPAQKSGWLRRGVVDRIRSAAGELPVEHLVAGDVTTGDANVLVIANETLLGGPLLDAIRARAAKGGASFMLVAPQSDPTQAPHPDAESRLKRVLTQLREEGIDVHGQVAHPDPFSAAMEAVNDERVDELIVSTFPGERSGWLRRDLIERLRAETKLPVEHVVVEAPAEVTA